MKKVIMLTNEFYPFKGGIGRYCEEIIREINNRYEVTLIAPKYDNSLKDNNLSKNIFLNLFDGGQFKYWDLPKLIRKVLSIKFDEYDYILVADWPFWIAIEFANKYFQKKIRFNLMLHGSEILNLKNGKASFFTKIVNIFDGVENIFTNSEFTKDILIKNHDVPKDIPLKVTYLGVNQNIIPDNKKYLSNVYNKEFNILTVGRLDDRKGYDYVIEAIGRLPNNVKKYINYIVVGNGSSEYKDKLEFLAKKNTVNFKLLSGINDNELSKLYQESNIFILAAKNNEKKIEGFGLVFLEAACYGVPSIGTDVGAISEVVKSGYTGLVVKEQIVSIAEAIQVCYEDRDMLIRYSNNCLVDVRKYTWGKLVESTFNIQSAREI